MGEFLFAGAFFLWFVLSIAKQFPSLESRLPGGVLGELLPNWKFFAPEPGTSDFRIVLRRLVSGEWTSWTDITPLRRQRIRWLWHPAKFEAKAVLDVVAILLDEWRRSNGQLEAIAISWPYLVLLQYVSGFADRASQVQFSIVQSRGFDSHRETIPLFASGIHTAVVHNDA
jgi:hypothetical protein